MVSALTRYRGNHRAWPLLVVMAVYASLAVDAVAQDGVETDRAALVALYNATGGANWRYNTNWLGSVPVGKWHGVTTDDDGRVTRLSLPINNLTGPIPPELGALTNLTALNLAINNLTGPIPPELGALTNLTALSLYVNNLTGSIPPELGALTNLTALSLYVNNLTGSIPPELGALTNLTALSLDNNNLTGPIPPELGALTNLTVLNLDNNNLTGPIPPELGALTNLTALSLDNNNLTGPVPAELGALTNLTVLNLDNNNLTGPIPPELGALTNLTALSLDNNNLTGPVPAELGALTNLYRLSIHSNDGLCAPTDVAFRARLATIFAIFRGDTCATKSFSIPNLGGWSTTSSGTETDLKEGYGRISAETGSTTPSGIAIFGFRQGGVLIAEAGVPATEPVQEGRIFAEVNGPVNTGLAIANPNDAPATIAFYFTDTDGVRFGEDSFELGAHEQIADFLNETPFNGGNTVLGTFTFTSSLPIAVIALRGFTNRDGDFLMTTLPVAPLATPLTPFTTDTANTGTVYFPHFADGSGWATQVILVNPTDDTIAGTVRFLDQGSATTGAAPAVLTLDDDRTGSSFDYSIPPNGSYRIVTSNPSGGVSVGSVRAIPDNGHRAPSGLVIFSFTSAGKTVLEAGVPALAAGSAFRVYVESSGTPEQIGSIRTGLAITNAADTANTVTLEVTNLDGTLAAPPGTLTIPPSGQVSRFIDEFFDSLPPHFSGVLRVTSTAEVAIVGLRLRYNNRGELKMTTTPPSDETGPSTMADRFFPHIVDSAGWSTQFILFSGTAGQASSGTLSFIDTAGAPWDLPTTLSASHPDRAALVALYNATDGPNWVNNENWLTDAPLRDWYGVATDADGRTVRLDLSRRVDPETRQWVRHGLSGPIPPELGNLSRLQQLNLSWNDLSGPIPPELGSLTRLGWLRLHNNGLSGSIPPELGNLSNLKVLTLDNNELTGPVPLELGELSELKRLSLSNNAALSGALPTDLSDLRRLEKLIARGHRSVRASGSRLPDVV